MKVIVPFEAGFMSYEDLVLEIVQRIDFLKTKAESKDFCHLARRLDIYIDYRDEKNQLEPMYEKVDYYSLEDIEFNKPKFQSLSPWALDGISHASVAGENVWSFNFNGDEVRGSFPKVRDYIVWHFVEVGLAELVQGKGV